MSQPYVLIDLDKPRKLRYRHNDLADLEVVSGKGLGELMSGQSFHGVRLLLQFGLRWQDSKMTLTKAGDCAQAWLDKGLGLDALIDKILDALRVSGFIKDAPGSENETGEGDEGNATAEAAD